MTTSPFDAAAHRQLVHSLQERMGDAAFLSEWSAAAGTSLDDCVAYATRMRGQRKRPSIGWASLTPTELKVAALVAEGLTNPQIGERLFMARRTAKIHVAHIFTKLGIANRAQLAALAVGKPGA